MRDIEFFDHNEPTTGNPTHNAGVDPYKQKAEVLIRNIEGYKAIADPDLAIEQYYQKVIAQAEYILEPNKDVPDPSDTTQVIVINLQDSSFELRWGEHITKINSNGTVA